MSLQWSELTGAEALAALQQLAHEDRQPVSGFLDTHQYASILELPELVVSGGFPAAQFRCIGLHVTPPLAYWTLRPEAATVELRSVRQLRGLLNRELRPDTVGDIAWGAHVALVTDAETDLRSVLPTAQPVDDWTPPVAAVERATAAATRVDSIVASLFRVSRAEAQTAVEYGFVFLNWRQVARRTETVKLGDQLVFRTKGRIELVSVGTNQRSGRCMLEFHRYPAG